MKWRGLERRRLVNFRTNRRRWYFSAWRSSGLHLAVFGVAAALTNLIFLEFFCKGDARREGLKRNALL